MEKHISWLLDQSPLIAYRTLIDLLDEPEGSTRLRSAYALMLEDKQVKTLLKDLEAWPGSVMKRHNDARLLFHKLAFLADIGINNEHEIIQNVIYKILQSSSPEGPFQIIGNIPTAFGGSGTDEAMWMICDAPTISYSLLKLNQGGDKRVRNSIDYLLSLVQDFGWPCAATNSLGGKFKGPGKRTHPCPYANLLMLKLISAQPELQESKEAHSGTEMLLDLWQNRKTTKYFLFGMGTDFSKLKAPFIWFDILHLAEVLSHFSFVYSDDRFLEIINLIKSKADNSGLFKAESIYMAWKEWDFGQKKEPSAWISFLVYRLLKRIKNN